jgi:hypothetical protein
LTHATNDPPDAGAARQAALLAAQRCSVHGVRLAPRLARVSSATKAGDALVVELRVAVEAYVAALKAAGRPPEATVVLVKQVIAEVDASADETEVLRREAVRWTIDAYYAS